MYNRATRNIVLSALFIALGIIIPILFHAVGMGSVFLPMHIPVILAGFFLDPLYSICVGALTPILSSLMTGMPPLIPTLPIMVFELSTYSLLVSIIYKKLKQNVFTSLIVSMLAGRVVAGLVAWVLVTFFSVKMLPPLVYIYTSIVNGIPGIIIQLILIPIIVMLVERRLKHG
ncbi:ECF transporter S component [Calorimonas adulescens]|uniref:ECF transporter S component n=1 Tax=Calorimonas adulescens TaxID=2606906 RepID=A0A5D8QA12_9THEO|nr:ECF transporter S component [Calorimonas adulescens]TZE80959.1 ECF transporter S component [Calorimonas adulescens]